MARLRRLITRLRWKADLLLHAHQLALSYALSEPPDNAPNDAPAPQSQHVESAIPPAISQFALDFLEFYTLLERALVLALALVGVSVPVRGVLPLEDEPKSSSNLSSSTATARKVNKGAIYTTSPSVHPLNALRSSNTRSTSQPIESTGGMEERAPHRFHANLLDALARQSCPLRHCLGEGDVHMYLRVAKGWRNRGKGAEDPLAEGQSNGAEGGVEAEVTRLQRLPLDGMMRAIVDGLEVAAGVVEARTTADAARAGEDSTDTELNMIMDWETIAPFDDEEKMLDVVSWV